MLSQDESSVSVFQKAICAELARVLGLQPPMYHVCLPVSSWSLDCKRVHLESWDVWKVGLAWVWEFHISVLLTKL